MARRAADDRNPHGGSARPPARGPLRAPRGVRPSVAHALTFKEGVSHGDLATELSADAAEPAPSVAGPERLTGAYRATRTLPVFPFGGSRAGIRRDSAFQSAVPPRSFRLRVSGAVAPSAPAPGGTGLSRGDRPAVTAMIGGARPLSTAGRGACPTHVTRGCIPRGAPRTCARHDRVTLVTGRPQRHLGAGPRDTAPMVTDAQQLFILQRHLGAGPRDTLGVVGLRLGLVLPSTSPRRWAEGYRFILGAPPPDDFPFNVTSALGRGIPRRGGRGQGNRRILQRHLGAWPRDMIRRQVRSEARWRPSTSPRRLAEGYPFGAAGAEQLFPPSTSPRRLAEGYVAEDAQAPRRHPPSTSPRRLAEGYHDFLGEVTGGVFGLQRHLGAWPRDTAASRAVDSRRIFPPISRASPFLAFHAFRGIGRGRASR